ncbi:hypothetical protein Poli38472_000323 [Pythium oligandrum]|uniref:Uncharacterized protein n=1 Tax=Pythium oligandrum TaxID=41045 RepID=A0A8K1CC91_PYTOL|nr:hypothetical protein Poli38472_000323 [Pythium oligandrum]|eukprot:TMW60281.1 hypothetical protein Poli38472_000323 [Pythium oligandrum]
MEFYATDHAAILRILLAKDNRHDAYAVRRSCHELSRLLLQNLAVRKKMVEVGLVPTMREIVSLHIESSVDVLVDCCHFLRRMISLKGTSGPVIDPVDSRYLKICEEPTELDIQTKITEAGFLGMFMSGLGRYPDHSGLFEEVCRLISLLCFDMPSQPHVENQSDIASTGFLRLLCEGLAAGRFGEHETQCATDALTALLYENASNVGDAVEELDMLTVISHVFAKFHSVPHIVENLSRSLFHIVTLIPETRESLIELRLIERLLDFLETYRPDHGDALVQWHVLKLLEMASRRHEATKDDICRCQGPIILVTMLQRPRFISLPARLNEHPLHLIALLLFGNLAVTRDGTTEGSPDVAPGRVDQLMRADAHQYAVQILRTTSGGPTPLLEQATRLLEILAQIGGFRLLTTHPTWTNQLRDPSLGFGPSPALCPPI